MPLDELDREVGGGLPSALVWLKEPVARGAIAAVLAGALATAFRRPPAVLVATLSWNAATAFGCCS